MISYLSIGAQGGVRRRDYNEAEGTVEGVGYIHYLDDGNGFTNSALNICSLLYVNYTPIKKHA